MEATTGVVGLGNAGVSEDKTLVQLVAVVADVLDEVTELLPHLRVERLQILDDKLATLLIVVLV